jgi:LPXTG-motif cell wall-anchored protein
MARRTRLSRRGAAIAGVATVAMASAAPVATAQDLPEYPPQGPSSASAVCVGDIPYLSFVVDFGPEFANNEVTITVQNPEGDDIVVVRTLDDEGRLSANDILWPGANDDPPDWPGWILDEDGNWVEADDGFLWARGTITVVFETNPTEVTQATYPPSSAICANPPTSETPPEDGDDSSTTTTTTTTTTGLPATGAQTATLALVGGGLLVGGTGLVISSRRRAARSEV